MSYLTADVESLLHEFDAFAAELACLPKSVETTGLELRFAMLRVMVEANLAVHSSNDNSMRPGDRSEETNAG